MRLEMVKHIESALDGGTLTVKCEMEYLPTCSNNRYKTREGIIRRDVQQWMEELALMVRLSTNKFRQGSSLARPVKVRIDGRFKDWRSCPDLHNFRKVVDDSIKHAIGIDDKFFETECGAPQAGMGDPAIIITVTAALKGGS